MTILDDVLIPEVVDIAATYGKSATFRTYPSRSVNATTSEVTLGSPTDYTVNVTPPSDVVFTITEDGRAEQVAGVQFLVPSGAGTSDALAFTITRGMEVTIDGTTGIVRRYDPIYSGTSICAYKVFLDR